MSSATCKPQHFAEDYSIAVYEKGDGRRKGGGTGLTSVGETRQSRLELSSCGTELMDWRY
jgi:hypothetical protein